MRLSGRRALVTGGGRGLGLSVAQAFAAEGAKVMVCARTRSELAKASPNFLTVPCDISSREDVDALARQVEHQLGGLDILVANAGVYGPKGAIEEVDWEEWTKAIQINLLGTVYCCRALLPILRRRAGGKILIMAGGGATRPLPRLSAYAASKAGLVRFGETLAEELQPAGIDVNMIAPGALNTRMLDEILEAGPGKVGEAFYQAALRQADSGGSSMERAAALCVHLVSGACEGVTGRLISAPWDPWPKLSDLREELMQSDIYTLRRIVPEDRGRKWSGD